MAIRVYSNGQQLVGLPANPFGIPAIGNISICGWVNLTSTPTGTFSMFGVYGTGGVTAVQIGIRVTPAIDVVAWTWGGSSLAVSTGVQSLLNNTWYHLSYTYNGTTHLLYINGVLVNSSTAAQITGLLNQTYINGYPTGGVNESGNAIMDDIEFYDRTLSLNEINTIYNAQGSRHGIVLNAKASYTFQELGVNATVISVKDISGHLADLAPVGTGTTPIYIEGLPCSDLRITY